MPPEPAPPSPDTPRPPRPTEVDLLAAVRREEAAARAAARAADRERAARVDAVAAHLQLGTARAEVERIRRERSR